MVAPPELIEAKFQPALPMRGVTQWKVTGGAASDFNPHSPCGE